MALPPAIPPPSRHTLPGSVPRNFASGPASAPHPLFQRPPTHPLFCTSDTQHRSHAPRRLTTNGHLPPTPAVPSLISNQSISHRASHIMARRPFTPSQISYPRAQCRLSYALHTRGTLYSLKSYPPLIPEDSSSYRLDKKRPPFWEPSPWLPSLSHPPSPALPLFSFVSPLLFVSLWAQPLLPIVLHVPSSWLFSLLLFLHAPSPPLLHPAVLPSP